MEHLNSGQNNLGDKPLDSAPVLVVDDKKENLHSFRVTLEQAGFTVVTASSGAEALKYLLNHHPSLVLLDVQMPEISGFETARMIRQNEQFVDLPILFITATQNTEAIVKQGYAAGCYDYLTKPIDSQILVNKVRLFHRLYLQQKALEERSRVAEALNQALQSNEMLQQAVETAEEASRAKDEFLASMSHELRTPLTAIIGNSELMALSDLGPSEQELLESIAISGKSLLYLINDILDNSKIKAGKFQIDHAAFDLSVLLRELRYIFQKRAEESGLSFEVVEKIDTGISCMGDGNRITQILVNLLGNAVKFTRSGGVQLKVDRDSVLSHLTFTVRDTGIGMSDEVIERLFQPFEQANREISNRFGGTGLGLFISSNLVELMHGKLTVESEEGSGSCFTLSLPLEILEQTELKGNVQQEQAVAVTQCQGNILIAEDAPELQLLERRMVEQLGPMVDVASNGVEAVSKAMSKDYDLILMDMQMPQMDGIEATRTLREQGVTVPIVALTANVMEHHKAQFYEAGCNDFLAKPIDRQLLAEVFVKYCR